jgi:Xaa-Pro aminopeptidase
MTHGPLPSSELVRRRERLAEHLHEQGLDAVFLPPSSDLGYLTGLERDVPSFGQLAYAHGWVAGAFLAPGAEPFFVLPRTVVAYHMPSPLEPAERADRGAELLLAVVGLADDDAVVRRFTEHPRLLS